VLAGIKKSFLKFKRMLLLKNFTLSVLALILMTCLLASSCKKYDEGYSFSLMSREKMLFGYWKLNKWIENDEELTSELQYKHEFGFALDGTYYYRYYDAHFNVNIEFIGTWEFRHNKEQLVLGLKDPRYGMEYQVWDITRFTKHELGLECVTPEKMVKWELVPR